MNTETFLKLIHVFELHLQGPNAGEERYIYPNGGSFWLRLRVTKNDYHVVATGEAKNFAAACLGAPQDKDGAGYPLWHLPK